MRDLKFTKPTSSPKHNSNAMGSQFAGIESEFTPILLKENLEKIFSVLPDAKAIEAQQRLLHGINDNVDLSRHIIKWADFDQSAQFKSAGIVDIAGTSFRLLKNKDVDSDIKYLIEQVYDGGPMVGSLKYYSEQNAIIWFVPNLEREKGEIPQAAFRGIFIPEQVVHEILVTFNPEASLTKAEKHLVFQLSAGLSLRDAANVDGLKIETKRSQLKSICSKMHLNGQSDLLRHILSQLTYFLSLTDVRNSAAAELSSFVSEFLAEDTRVIEQALSNGRTIRVLERGPADGKAILMLHGILWPLLLIGPSDYLRKLNIRMIMPIRLGYIDNGHTKNLNDKADLVTRSLQDIALFHREHLRRETPIVGVSFGGCVAINYAEMFPDLCDKIIVVGMHSSVKNRQNRKFLGKLFDGLKALSHQPGVFRDLAWQFKRYYADEKTVKPILEKMHAGCEMDLSLLGGKFDSLPFYKVFVALFQQSANGISDDFLLTVKDIGAVAERIDKQLLFIHGDQDPMSDIQQIYQYADRAQNAEIAVIEGGGHHLLRTHSYQIWTKILDFASEAFPISDQ